MATIVPTANAAPGDAVTGTVFQDFNSNGVMDTAASNTGLGGVGVQDVGVAGVDVTAYDDAGTEVGSATTGADGTYSIDTSALAANTPLRIEFDTPSGYYPAVHGPAASASQDNNGTSVQFTTVGSSNRISYGVEDPDDVSVTNPPIMATMNSQGGWNIPSQADNNAWVIQPYNSGNTHAAATVLGTYADVGSVWSTVFSQATNSGYAAASLRRDSALGPLGLGGIYRVGDLVGKDGQLDSGHGTVEQWLDVTALGIDIGQSNVPSNEDRGVTQASSAADPAAFEWAGRAGIGGIAVDKAGTTMYVANLYDNAVYALPLDPNDPGAAPTTFTKIDTPVAAGQQISAVAVHDGKLYIGYVDTTGENRTLTSPKESASDADLKAHVASTPIASPGTWTSTIDFSLGYHKPTHYVGIAAPSAQQWNTWSNTFDACNALSPTDPTCMNQPYNTASSHAGWLFYSQAMVSGIAFDSQGFMAIALGDRWELQIGNGNPSSPCTGAYPGYGASGFTGCTLNGADSEAQVYVTQPVAGGQTLQAAPNTDGTYTLENNGVVGDRTSTHAASISAGSLAAGIGNGPGGTEFFDNRAVAWNPHSAASLGSVTTVPGGAQVVNTALDPTGVNQSGLDWLNMTNGTANGNYFETSQFAKGTAMGGVTSVITPPGIEIGNRVWLDRDGDGIQDADTAREPSVAGEVVQLLDSDGNVLAATTTDSNGNYYFNSDDIDGFEPNGGDYTVAFINPSTLPTTDPNYKSPTSQAVPAYNDGTTTQPAISWGQLNLTKPNAGDNAAIDSNAKADQANPKNGTASYTAGKPGENDHTLDAGLAPLVSIGDYLWIDSNNNGVQDADEPPVADATVTLLDADGNTVATTTTDENGYYAFTSLAPSTDYTVQFPTLVTVDGVDYVLVAQTQGTDTARDSNPDQQSGRADVTTPPSGDNSGEPNEADDPTIDAGYFPKPVSLGDYLWIDSNRDGIQDADESPVSDATVTLKGLNGDVVATTTTDENGYYSFTGLVPNTGYTVEFPTTVTVDGIDYELTQPFQGTDQAKDSNPDPTSGAAPALTPKTGNNSGEPGEADEPTIDAGYVAKPVSIGDYLWLDANGNGVQDDGEPSVPEGTSVALLNADGSPATDVNGNPVPAATTDADGYYSFTDLAPDTDYTVVFPTTVTVDGIDYGLTQPTQGDSAKDSNPSQSTGKADVTTPKKGDNSGEPGDADDPTIDAGYVAKPVSIGDYLWIDTDRDGVQDEGEPVVPEGTVVTLLDADGNPVETTQTNADGYYAFTDLAPDTDYVVQFPTTVAVDGVNYTLTAPTEGDDTAADSNPSPTTGEAPVTTPKSGNNLGTPGDADDPTIDAGYISAPVSIGDYLWIDSNRDGIQQDDEPVVPEGTTVTLLDADGNPATDVNGNPVPPATTDANGYYSFTDLAPDTDYVVQFPTEVTVDGIDYGLTQPTQGDDAAKDSNPKPATGQAPVTTPKSGNNLGTPGDADDPTIDAGYVTKPVSVGDYLWLDSNGNGVQDEGESPVPGATITLVDADGNPATDVNGNPVPPATTDADGYYSFTDLAPDTDYVVQFPTEVTVDGIDYALIEPGAGDDSSADSNPDQSTGKAPVTTPKSGDNSGEHGKADDPTIDAGYFPKPVSVGDYLWLDSNGNGVQDEGESPVPGATITLVDADGNPATDVNGNPVPPATTDADGYYSFTDLAPDTDYVVQFPTTVTVDGNKYTLTEPTLGDDTAADSNPNPSTGKAPVTTPKSGDNSGEHGKADNPTIDAGYRPLVSIGDYVWIDSNGNGVQDKGETPVAGATVTLLNANGETVATTKTDKNGYYSFTDLAGGTDYTVAFPTSVTVDGIDYALTKPSQGKDRAVDSNPNQQSGKANVTTPAAGKNLGTPGKADNPTIDAGYFPKPVSIGDYLWIDANGDGVQQPGEKPVPGATVTLLDADGNTVATTKTGKDGYYSFTGLVPNTDYTVVFPTVVTVDGVDYGLTKPGQGKDRAADSNPDQKTGQAPVTTPKKGSDLGTPGDADIPTIDAGYVALPVSVGNKLWIDSDGDGVQDSGEPSVPGVTVTLVDVDGNTVATTKTDKDGYYVFTGLAPNTKYGVQFPKTVTIDGKDYQLTAPGQGDDGAKDSNPSQSTGIAWFTSPKSGQNSSNPVLADNPTIDAGYVAVKVADLSYTGVDPWSPAELALVLLLLGGGLLVLDRRRRSHRTAESR